MKYFRAVAVIVIIISAVGYLHAQAATFDPTSIFSGGCNGINTTGAGRATAEAVSATNSPKLKAILMSDAQSGYLSKHGILGILNLGFGGGQAASKLCGVVGSDTEACQTLSRAGGLGRMLTP